VLDTAAKNRKLCSRDKVSLVVWLVNYGVTLSCLACPQNCKDCQTDNSATVATCTVCNDYYRLISATVNSVTVAGACYRMFPAHIFVFQNFKL